MGHPITGRLAVRFPLSPLKKIGETDSWRGGSPPPRHDRTPMLPGRCEWLLTAPVCGVCLYECVSTGANLNGLKACECKHDNKSDLNPNLLSAATYLHRYSFSQVMQQRPTKGLKTKEEF